MVFCREHHGCLAGNKDKPPLEGLVLQRAWTVSEEIYRISEQCQPYFPARVYSLGAGRRVGELAPECYQRAYRQDLGTFLPGASRSLGANVRLSAQQKWLPRTLTTTLLDLGFLSFE